MSDLQDTTFHKAGQIQVREGKKGTEFYAFNFQHKKPLHIGTLIGSVYEKTAPILHKPEPSFSLPKSELGAAIAQGAAFIRFIARGAFGTYSISVEDYERYGEPYYNAAYGPQIRVPLTKFQRIAKVEKRNPIVDNPVIITKADPEIRQKTLF
jgi:hypothetical protein